MDPFDTVQEKAGRTLALALRREAAAPQHANIQDTPFAESAERLFPVLVQRRLPLTVDEASDLLDNILEEHSRTMGSLAE